MIYLSILFDRYIPIKSLHYCLHITKDYNFRNVRCYVIVSAKIQKWHVLLQIAPLEFTIELVRELCIVFICKTLSLRNEKCSKPFSLTNAFRNRNERSEGYQK